MTKLGIEIPIYKGKQTTNAIVLARINHPFTNKLLEYRKSSKRVSTYGEEFLRNINPVTGRIHPEFNQLGANTGRFSSESPNFQNLPKKEDGAKFRKCFITPDGYDMISADFSGQEIMVMAELSKDPELIKIYQEGKDRHTTTAATIFGVPYEKVNKNQRALGKKFNFCVSYGGTAWRVALELKIPIDKAEQYLNAYWGIYAVLQKRFRRAGLLALHNGYSTTMLGRRRYYPDISNKDEIMRQGANHEVQGTSASMTKAAIVEIDNWSRNNKVTMHFTNFVHDEIVIESLKCDTSLVAPSVKECMEKAGREFVKVIDQEAEVLVGDYWL
jgi:DNA polymerase-1